MAVVLKKKRIPPCKAQNLEESGLDVMQERERRAISQAHEDFELKKSTGANSKFEMAKSPLVEENISSEIAAGVSSGLDAEDAAEEAILNCLVGNESVQKQVASVDSLDLSDPAQSSSFSSSGGSMAAVFQAAFSNWMEELSISLKALQARQIAMREKPVGDNKEISLVLGRVSGISGSESGEGVTNEETDSAFFVHWKTVGSTGRPISLDASNRVKCIVATGALKEARDYRHVQIIHPAIGVRMERIRGFAGMLRPEVPPAVMRLFSMWQAALVAKGNAGQDQGLALFRAHMQPECPCFVCNQSQLPVAPPDVDADTDVGDVGLDDVQVCSLCLLASHGRCALKLAEYGHGRGVNFSIDALSSSISAEAPVDIEKDFPGIFVDRLNSSTTLACF